MEFILGDVLFTIVGWVSMLIKHRNFAQMRIVINEKYENQYSSVGREILSNTFLKIFALLIFSLIFVTLVVFIVTK